MHPHAQRQLATLLRDIASAADHQVLACSHSTHFVNLDYYRSIAVVSKENTSDGTRIRQCVIDLFEGDDDKKNRFHMAHWVNPDRGEMFFARRVILVEGETERVALPFVAEKIGYGDASVSVVDCGSKFNLPLYMKILNAFQIQYLVVHDEDPVPDSTPQEWSADKLQSKRRTFEFNNVIASTAEPDFGNVFMVERDFESMVGISKGQGDRKGKAVAALDIWQTYRQRTCQSRSKSW